MRQRALLNGGISLRPAYESSPAFEDPSTQALLRLWDIWRRRAVPYGIARDALRAMAAPHKAVQALRSRLGASDEGHPEWRLRSLVECTADPDNRVELGDERDALGRPRPRVRWRVRELDLRSARETHGVFAEVVQRAGHGEVSVHEGDWNERMQPALHHLGTTRMHDDPARGVVDRDARVHGIDNLYAAGGSVFTTAGFANPTLTILALTLRLARHLKGQ
jgi:choline dehydrogenase-like flavoprotein